MGRPLAVGFNKKAFAYVRVACLRATRHLPSHQQPDESFRLAEHVGVAHADGIDLFACDGLSVLAHMELHRVDHLGELLGPHAAVRGDETIHYGFGKGHYFLYFINSSPFINIGAPSTNVGFVCSSDSKRATSKLPKVTSSEKT